MILNLFHASKSPEGLVKTQITVPGSRGSDILDLVQGPQNLHF